ncbi:MAG TPA: sugar phosphate isomerase/epimerase family protein [bacterium]|nr:sugar phosphate isomerase/epimerase family protein [bacterium]
MKTSLYLAATGSRFWAASSGLALDDAVAKAAALGFDAVEIMPRDVDDPDPARLRATAERAKLGVAAIASGFIAIERGLTFTHPNPEDRRRAVQAMRECMDAARRAGAPLVSIGIIRGKLQPGTTRAEAMRHLIDCIRECGRRAGDLGLVLAVEPGNRYETDFIHTVTEGLELVGAVGLPSVRLMIDTFHMNIEEASIPGAIRQAAPYLAHVHFADSNRRAPGWGHLDFPAVAATLREIGYRRTIGLEMTLAPDFEAAARQGVQFVRALFRTD